MTKVAQPFYTLQRPAPACLARLSLIFVLGCLGLPQAQPLQAQEADAAVVDSVAADSVAVDSVAVDSVVVDSVVAAESVAVDSVVAADSVAEDSAAVGLDVLPVRLPALDLAELLGDVPGTFLYRFGTPGWPEGWSYHGLSPGRPAMTFNGIPFSHVFTGRAGFDVAPLAYITAPRLEAGGLDRPITVRTRLRPYVTAAPYTEFKYWNGAAELESIDGVHAQNRRQSLFGRPGFLNLVGAYSGRGSDGAYPGSRLERGRQVQFRVRYVQAGWSMEVLNVQTRRNVGAHGGVIPDPSGFESIFSTVGAVVENPQATRRTVRNDLLATGGFAVLDNPVTVTGFWTAETYRYRDEVDTVGTQSNRLGFRVVQPLAASANRATSIALEGWMEHVDPSLGFEAPGFRRSELHMTGRDSVSFFGWRTQTRLSAHAYDGSVHPGGRIEIERDAGALGLSAGGGLAGQPASPVEQMGFRALGAVASARSGRIADVFVGLEWHGGAFDVRLRAFGSRSSDPRDIYMMTDYRAVPDSAAFLVAPSAMVRAGGMLDIGWRRHADLGVYAYVQPSMSRLLESGDSELHFRTSRATPWYFGKARLGLRALLFRGDLDLDAFVDAYAWSGGAGRTLHPETGLLAIPLSSAIQFGPSSMINVGAEARVRTATLFFIYQNALAGTQMMVGTLNVPLYPIPGQQFRLGVYWPIFD